MTGSATRADADPLFDEAFMAKLEHLEVVTRKVFASPGRGERRSRRQGAGLEFADHRRYSPGDDFRNIDWNVYARLGKLLLRVYEEEEDLWVYVLVDASRSMAVPDGRKLDHARRLAAAIAYVTLSGLDRVAVGTFSDKLDQQLNPARGKAWMFRTFDFLRRVQPSGATSFAEAMRSFAHSHKRHGIVFILSDLYAQDGYEQGIDVLRHHRFEPVIVQLSDRRELEPGLMGDVGIVDCETGERRELTVTPRLLAQYRAAHDAWRQEIQGFCRARQVPWFEAAVETPFEDIVLNMLRRGGILA